MYVDVVPFVNNFVDLFSFTSLQSYLHILKKLIKKVDFLALYTISYDSRVMKANPKTPRLPNCIKTFRLHWLHH